MSSSLESVLADLRSAQVESVNRQKNVAASINEALAGGISGVAKIADALEQLQQSPPPATVTPAGTSPGDSAVAPSLLNQALTALAQAQLDATRRQEHIANAVTAAVVGGTDSLSQVTSALRRLQKDPGLLAERPTAVGDDRLVAPPIPNAPQMFVCPTCAGSGHVKYGD